VLLYQTVPSDAKQDVLVALTQHVGVADGWFTRAGAVPLRKDSGFGLA
jgi:hypothetical protein